MAEIDHEKVRVIAYELWERDGSPEGKDDEYWHAAVKLLSDEADMREADDPMAVSPLPSLTPPV